MTLPSINSTTVQDVLTFDFSNVAVTKYTDGKDFLLVYDSDKRGLYSFELGEELGRDNSGK